MSDPTPTDPTVDPALAEDPTKKNLFQRGLQWWVPRGVKAAQDPNRFNRFMRKSKWGYYLAAFVLLGFNPGSLVVAFLFRRVVLRLKDRYAVSQKEKYVVATKAHEKSRPERELGEDASREIERELDGPELDPGLDYDDLGPTIIHSADSDDLVISDVDLADDLDIDATDLAEELSAEDAAIFPPDWDEIDWDARGVFEDVDAPVAIAGPDIELAALPAPGALYSPLQQDLIDTVATDLAGRASHVMSRRELHDLVASARAAMEQDLSVSSLVRSVRSDELTKVADSDYLQAALVKAGLEPQAARLVEFTAGRSPESLPTLTATQQAFSQEVQRMLEDRFGVIAIDPSKTTIIPTTADARLARTAYERDLVRAVTQLRQDAIERQDPLGRAAVAAELGAVDAKTYVGHALQRAGFQAVERDSFEMQKTGRGVEPAAFTDPAQLLAYNAGAVISDTYGLTSAGAVVDGASGQVLDQIMYEQREQLLSGLTASDRAAFEARLDARTPEQLLGAALKSASIERSPSQKIVLQSMER